MTKCQVKWRGGDAKAAALQTRLTRATKQEGDRASGGRFEIERLGCLQEQAAPLCHSEPYNCQAEDETLKVSGEESPRIMSGILRAKNDCHPQNDVTANALIATFSRLEKELVPSTCGRGKEFQRDEGELEIQGEGAIYNRRFFANAQNDVMVYKPIKFIRKRQGKYAQSKLVKILLTYLPANLLTPVNNLASYYPGALVPSRKAAFTLAEVLITLGIIGVVAAMTLPALIGSYRKSVAETALKKFYTTMNQAVLQSVSDNGETKYWEFTTSNTPSVIQNEFYNKYFKKYLKSVKTSLGGEGTDSSLFTIYFEDGSGAKVAYMGHDWYYCTEARYLKDFSKYQGTRCFRFGFYPQFTSCGGFLTSTYHNKGIEPYVQCASTDENGDTITNENGGTVNTTVEDIYRQKHYAKIIQLNGWKVPADYPLKF